jgi:hypothetical protein
MKTAGYHVNIEECYSSETKNKNGKDMYSILEVNGNFESNFDNGDDIANRVHCAIYKIQRDAEMLKVAAANEYIQQLIDENSRLKEAQTLNPPNPLPPAAVGNKRPRANTDDESDRLAMNNEVLLARMQQMLDAKVVDSSSMQQMLNATVTDPQLQRERDEKEKLQKTVDALNEDMNDALLKIQKKSDAYNVLNAAHLQNIEEYNRLKKETKTSQTKMGFATRAMGDMLELDFSTPEGVAAATDVQAKMFDIMTSVHTNRYLSLANVPDMAPFSQATLDTWVSKSKRASPA